MWQMLALLLVEAPLPVCGPAAEIAFREGAPVDRFFIENASVEDWSIARVEIGLAGSAGRLVFDTVPGGAGRNVSRPFRAEAGEARLSAAPDVPDGAEGMALDFSRFGPGERFVFSIDMDDRMTAVGGTQVAASELFDAAVTVTFAHARGGTEIHAARFDDRNRARPAAPCLS